MKSKRVFVFLFLTAIVPSARSQKVFFSGNDFNSVFICEDGRVFASGGNSIGQLGNGTYTPSNSPVSLTGIDGLGTLPPCKQVQIEGVASNLALTNSGDTVLSWGVNDYGQIGDGTTTTKPFPVRVKGVTGIGYLQNVKQIATGNYSSYALTEDQKIVGWGSNQFGQLGNGTFSPNVVYPDYILKAPGDTLKNVRSISAGAIFCMALLCDGTVWAWGSNGGGELGQNNTTNSFYAVQVKNNAGTGYLSNIKKIEAGDNYGFALSTNDTLWCWGTNSAGELGVGNTVTRFVLPTYTRSISGTSQLAGVTDIAAGQGHALALLSDNTLVSWGINSSGQLGNNTTVSSTLPLHVLDESGVNPLTAINYVATGDHFSIARTSDNQLYIWGRNNLGQLGLGDNTNRLLPSSLTLPCVSTSDIFPGYGKMVSPSSPLCSGTNNGNVYLSKFHTTILAWEYSLDNFISIDTVINNNFSNPYSDLMESTYYRAILSECGTNIYSPTAFIQVDPFTRSGILQSADTVRKYYNKDTLRLTEHIGSVVQWEWSDDNFSSNLNLISNTSDTQLYSELMKTTYYRALVKSGVCEAIYSNSVEIKTIDSKDVKIYDSFTPNGDHYNDDWYIDLIELFPDNKVEIYNRWGQLVYKTDHYDNVNRVWRGESNVSGSTGTTLADGTFFYMVDLGSSYSIQKGYVVISR